MKTTKQSDKQFTISGTDIKEVKRQNANSGLTYNEVKALLQKEFEQKGHPEV